MSLLSIAFKFLYSECYGISLPLSFAIISLEDTALIADLYFLPLTFTLDREETTRTSIDRNDR